MARVTNREERVKESGVAFEHTSSSNVERRPPAVVGPSNATIQGDYQPLPDTSPNLSSKISKRFEKEATAAVPTEGGAPSFRAFQQTLEERVLLATKARQAAHQHATVPELVVAAEELSLADGETGDDDGRTIEVRPSPSSVAARVLSEGGQLHGWTGLTPLSAIAGPITPPDPLQLHRHRRSPRPLSRTPPGRTPAPAGPAQPLRQDARLPPRLPLPFLSPPSRLPPPRSHSHPLRRHSPRGCDGDSRRDQRALEPLR